MVYLGVKDNTEDKGLYLFETVTRRDEIARNFSDVALYDRREKRKAIEELGISENEIKDGIILIRKYRHSTRSKMDTYLGVVEPPYSGVYFFKRSDLRDKIARDMGNLAILGNKEDLLNKMNLTDQDIKDGGILMSSDFNVYLNKYKLATLSVNESEISAPQVDTMTDVSKETVKSTDSATESVDNVVESAKEDVKACVESESNVDDKSYEVKGAEVSMVEVPMAETPMVEESHNFSVIDIFKTLGEVHDIVEVTMSTGDVYKILMNDIYYVKNSDIFNEKGLIDKAGKFIFKKDIVNELIKNRCIVKLGKSVVSKKGNLVYIQGCDDSYSPNVSENSGLFKINHEIAHIFLNFAQMTSIKGADNFEDLNFVKLDKKIYSELHKYLNETI